MQVLSDVNRGVPHSARYDADYEAARFDQPMQSIRLGLVPVASSSGSSVDRAAVSTPRGASRLLRCHRRSPAVLVAALVLVGRFCTQEKEEPTPDMLADLRELREWASEEEFAPSSPSLPETSSTAPAEIQGLVKDSIQAVQHETHETLAESAPLPDHSVEPVVCSQPAVCQPAPQPWNWQRLLRALVLDIPVALLVALLIGSHIYTKLMAKVSRSWKQRVETWGRHLMGVSVLVGDVEVSLRHGTVELVDVIVKNPTGYASAKPFMRSSCCLELNLTEIFWPFRSRKLNIQRLTVDDINVIVEYKDTFVDQWNGDSNIKTIYEKLCTKDFTGVTDQQPTVSVQQFQMEDARMELANLRDGAPMVLQESEFDNFGGSGEVSETQLQELLRCGILHFFLTMGQESWGRLMRRSRSRPKLPPLDMKKVKF